MGVASLGDRGGGGVGRPPPSMCMFEQLTPNVISPWVCALCTFNFIVADRLCELSGAPEDCKGVSWLPKTADSPMEPA